MHEWPRIHYAKVQMRGTIKNHYRQESSMWVLTNKAILDTHLQQRNHIIEFVRKNKVVCNHLCTIQKTALHNASNELKIETLVRIYGQKPQGIHLVDQYLIMFIHKGGFLIVKNKVNIFQVLWARNRVWRVYRYQGYKNEFLLKIRNI